MLTERVYGRERIFGDSCSVSTLPPNDHQWPFFLHIPVSKDMGSLGNVWINKLLEEEFECVY